MRVGTIWVSGLKQYMRASVVDLGRQRDTGSERMLTQRCSRSTHLSINDGVFRQARLKYNVQVVQLPRNSLCHVRAHPTNMAGATVPDAQEDCVNVILHKNGLKHDHNNSHRGNQQLVTYIRKVDTL